MSAAHAVSSALSVELAKEDLTAADYKVIFYLIGVLVPDGEYRPVDPHALRHILGVSEEAAAATVTALAASGLLETDGPYLYRWSATAVRAGE